MEFAIESRHLDEVVVITCDAFHDNRGFFSESFRADQFHNLGLPCNFVQDNHSYSHKGVIRGLHFQWDPPMGKLMRVTRGRAFLVAVDIRKGSPTVGKWYGLEVSSEDRKQIWAPHGFARGFCALTDDVEVQYKCTGIYNSKGESAVRWNDPDIAIVWPRTDVTLSDKDRHAQSLRQWLATPDANRVVYQSPATVGL